MKKLILSIAIASMALSGYAQSFNHARTHRAGHGLYGEKIDQLQSDATGGLWIAGQLQDSLPGTEWSVPYTLNLSQRIFIKKQGSGTTFLSQENSQGVLCLDLATDAVGNCYYLNVVGSSAEAFYGKLNPGGNAVFGNIGPSVYGTDIATYASDIAVDNNGSAWLLYFDRWEGLPSENYYVIVGKIDPNTGLIIQRDTLAGLASVFSSYSNSRIMFDNQNNLILTGEITESNPTLNFYPLSSNISASRFSSAGGTPDYFIAKFDPNKQIQWTKVLHDVDPSNGYNLWLSGLDHDNSGNIYFSGYSNNGIIDLDPGNGQVTADYNTNNSFVASWDASGNFRWKWNAIPSGFEQGVGIQFNGWESSYSTNLIRVNRATQKLYHTGTFYGNAIFSGIPGDHANMLPSTISSGYSTPTALNGHELSYLVGLDLSGAFLGFNAGGFYGDENVRHTTSSTSLAITGNDSIVIGGSFEVADLSNPLVLISPRNLRNGFEPCASDSVYFSGDRDLFYSKFSICNNTPTVSLQLPANDTACLGASFQKSFTVTGNCGRYVWGKLSLIQGTLSFSPIDTAQFANIQLNGSTLSFSNVTFADSGLYVCTAFTECGPLTSRPMRLHVQEPIVAGNASQTDYDVCPSDLSQITLEFVHDGSGAYYANIEPVSYNWTYNSQSQANTDGSLTLDQPLNSSVNGTYIVTASNFCTSPLSQTYTVLVRDSAAITLQPAAYTQLCEGEGITLTSNTTGDINGVQWVRNSIAVPDADGNSLTEAPGALSPGQYTYYLSVQGFCNLVVSQEAVVDMYPVYAQTVSPAICSGSMYTLPSGQTVSSADTYVTTLQSVNGCDSTVTTVLTVDNTISVTEEATICQGQTYLLPDGSSASQTDIYTFNYQTVSGCDSTYTVDLFVDICIGINNPTVSTFTVWPNPATSILFINTGDEAGRSIAIYTVSGQKLNEQPFTPQMDISALPAGIYFIEVTGDDTIGRKRFVKM